MRSVGSYSGVQRSCQSISKKHLYSFKIALDLKTLFLHAASNERPPCKQTGIERYHVPYISFNAFTLTLINTHNKNQRDDNINPFGMTDA